MSRPISIDSVGNRRIVAALHALGPMTIDDLAVAACVSRRTLSSSRYYIKALLEAGRIRIVGWKRAHELERSGPPVPVFAAGPGQSVPRPEPMSNSERAERYRTTAKYRAYLTRKTARLGGVAAVDPILAAMVRPIHSTEVQHG